METHEQKQEDQLEDYYTSLNLRWWWVKPKQKKQWLLDWGYIFHSSADRLDQMWALRKEKSECAQILGRVPGTEFVCNMWKFGSLLSELSTIYLGEIGHVHN